MSLRRFISAVFALMLIQMGASAQTVIEFNKGETIRRGRAEKSVFNRGTTGIMEKTIEFKDLPIDVNRLPDDARMKEIEKEFQDRQWLNEETAWNEASKTNTKEAYEKYIAIYPNGAHRPEATAMLIQMRVADAFTSAHESLPPINHVYVDDDSPVSTIVVENATGMPLTVMYSGVDAKSIVIEPDGKGVVTVSNGFYNIAADVPSPSVTAFAGNEVFRGGRYEVTFYIVRRNY